MLLSENKNPAIRIFPVCRVLNYEKKDVFEITSISVVFVELIQIDVRTNTFVLAADVKAVKFQGIVF